MMDLFVSTHASSLGRLTIVSSPRGLRALSLGDEGAKETAVHTGRQGAPVRIIDGQQRNHVVALQVEEYLAGERREFSLPLDLQGTRFQRRVWAALCAIPYGETRSYGELAAALGVRGGGRAVGAASARNPAPLVVPCHRLVGADGSLRGYRGGVLLKQRLLQLEGTRDRRGRCARRAFPLRSKVFVEVDAVAWRARTGSEGGSV